MVIQCIVPSVGLWLQAFCIPINLTGTFPGHHWLLWGFSTPVSMAEVLTLLSSDSVKAEDMKDLSLCFLLLLSPLNKHGSLRLCSVDPGGSTPITSSLCMFTAPLRWEREGNGNPLQYSCLENFMDRGAWPATDHGVTTEQLTVTNMKEGYLPTGDRAVPTGTPLGACVLDTHCQKKKKKKNINKHHWRIICPQSRGCTDFHSRTLSLSHREGFYPVCLNCPGPLQNVAHPLGVCSEQTGFCGSPPFSYGQSAYLAVS